jgi:IS30 family transposase
MAFLSNLSIPATVSVIGEIDTVLGKHGTGSIVTILERKTRFYLIKKVASKSAEDVTKATIELLMPY